MDGHPTDGARQVMRLGTDFIRIKSKSGRMPDWNPDEKVTRKDREKVRKFERQQKRRQYEANG